MKINLHIDTKAYQKKPIANEVGSIKARLQKGVRPVTVTVQGLLEQIGDGCSVSPAIMNGSKASDWKSQQLFLVDIDNEQGSLLTTKQAVKICRDKGLPLAFYYHTFSSTKQKPKFRLGFVASSAVTSEKSRKIIMDTLVSLFPQSDTQCKNADRIFFGTNKRVRLLDAQAFFSQRQIKALYHPTSNLSNMAKGPIQDGRSHDDPFSLEALKKSFDFLSFLVERNGSYTWSNNQAHFTKCEICGHKDDLVYYHETNTFYCFSSHGSVGGSIIDYLIHADKLPKKQAIDKFMYELCGLEKQVAEWTMPVPFEEVKLPTFPLNCLPPLLRVWVKAVAENTATAIDMAAVAALAVIATTVQGKFVMRLQDNYTEPLNLYILIIARPGERKSAIMKTMTTPLYQYEKEENHKRQSQIDEQGIRMNALARKIEECEKKDSVESTIKYKFEYRIVLQAHFNDWYKEVQNAPYFARNKVWLL